MYILADQTLFWTLGYALSLPLSDMKNLTLKMRLKKILNPVIIGILLALFGILINLRLPDVLNQTLTKVGQSCLSISLIYIGGLFCYIDIKKALKRLEFYLIIPIKMLLIPTLLFLLFSRLSIDPVMAATLTICCALPTMISLPMIAQTNGTDGEYLIGGLLITTLFSIFTLPLVGAVIAFLS